MVENSEGRRMGWVGGKRDFSACLGVLSRQSMPRPWVGCSVRSLDSQLCRMCKRWRAETHFEATAIYSSNDIRAFCPCLARGH
jgi:hypothetical protein